MLCISLSLSKLAVSALISFQKTNCENFVQYIHFIKHSTKKLNHKTKTKYVLKLKQLAFKAKLQLQLLAVLSQPIKKKKQFGYLHHIING